MNRLIRCVCRLIDLLVDYAVIAALIVIVWALFVLGSRANGQTAPTTQAAPTTQPALHPGVPWPTTLPSVPEVPLPACDLTLTVAPTGSDAAGDGSLAAPVQTIQRAITLAQQRGAKYPRVQLAAGGVYPMPWGNNFPGGANAFSGGLVIDGVGNGPYPVIAAGDNWNFIRCHDVQLRHLIFVAQKTGIPDGVYGDTCSNLLVDRCKFYGYNFGIALGGGSDNHGLRVYRTGFLYQDSGTTADSSGLFVQGIPDGDTAEIGGCTFLHCGWAVNFDTTNAALVNSLARKHGGYINEFPYPPAGGQVHFYASIAVDCASRGFGCRHGGTFEDLVFRGNGTAADLNVGNASYPNGKATLRRIVCFGCAVDGTPFWGAGIEAAPYVVYDASDIYGFSASTSQLNPLFTSFWDAYPLQPQPGHNAGNGPMPAGTLPGFLTGLHGVWPKAALASSGGRPLPSVTNNDVRPPRPGEQLPTLAAYYGVPESQLYPVLESRVEFADAPAIVAWSAQAWATMNPPASQPAPIIVPATQPAPTPFDVTLHVDPATQKVTQK